MFRMMVTIMVAGSFLLCGAGFAEDRDRLQDQDMLKEQDRTMTRDKDRLKEQDKVQTKERDRIREKDKIQDKDKIQVRERTRDRERSKTGSAPEFENGSGMRGGSGTGSHK
jgi:hypothetical protein